MTVGYCFEAWNSFLKKDPKAVVLSDSIGHDITRAEADEISSRVHAWLEKHDVHTGDYVFIHLERGVKPVLAMMGVWKHGSAFTVVEQGTTEERTACIKEDWQPKIEINEKVWPEILTTEPLQGYHLPNEHDAACGVYTSGTSGKPKGILHEFGQIRIEMISRMKPDGTWREHEKTRCGLVTPLNHVVSLKLMIGFLYSGGHLYVIDYDTIKNTHKLSSYFLKNRINETFLSPSLLRLKGPDFGPYMRVIYTGAEPANNVYVNKAELINNYSMSESLFSISEFVIDKPHPICPVGNPLFNLDIKLIDEQGKEVAEGKCGELTFYNPFCRGYINHPELNEKSFTNGYFHTGDLAYYRDGMYTLCGRRDDMIKIDGNRIDPSEIEAACKDILGASFCIAKGFEEQGFVALYYIGDISFDEEAVREKLSLRLPYYMIPSFFIQIEKIPMNASGKLDRKLLSVPKDYFRAEYIAPSTVFERKLVDACEKVLEMNHLSMKDDFFKLGGNSIKVIELLSNLDESDVLTAALIYQGRTLERISNLFNDALSNSLSIEEKEELAKQAPIPVSRTLRWYWDNANDGSLDFFKGYRLSWFVPTQKLTDRLNDYIQKNSTFNMVLTEDPSGELKMVYQEAPAIVVEHMSEQEALKEKSAFIRPFNLGEPLIRFRVIKTPLHTYLFFHAFHMVVDGAGMHLMIEDIEKALKKQHFDSVYWFAWALDDSHWSQPEYTDETLGYLKDNYFDSGYDICINSDQNTGAKGVAVSKSAQISLERVRKYCASNNISVNTFIVAASLLAQSTYNGTDRNMVVWNFSNRGPKDQHAGCRMRAAYVKMDRSKISNLADLYNSINRQNEDILWRLSNHDYYADFPRTLTEPTIAITYLEDWFSGNTLPKILGTEMELENRQEIANTAEVAYALICTHEKDKLNIVLRYSLSFHLAASADNFIGMLQSTMEQMIEDKIFSRKGLKPTS